jgi:hypothetical protein
MASGPAMAAVSAGLDSGCGGQLDSLARSLDPSLLMQILRRSLTPSVSKPAKSKTSPEKKKRSKEPHQKNNVVSLFHTVKSCIFISLFRSVKENDEGRKS